jgi:hypothetical protein
VESIPGATPSRASRMERYLEKAVQERLCYTAQPLFFAASKRDCHPRLRILS